MLGYDPHGVGTAKLLTVLVSSAAHRIRHHDLRRIGLEDFARWLVPELIDHRSNDARLAAIGDKAVNNIYRLEPMRKVGDDLGGRQVSVRKGEIPTGTAGAESVVSG